MLPLARGAFSFFLSSGSLYSITSLFILYVCDLHASLTQWARLCSFHSSPPPLSRGQPLLGLSLNSSKVVLELSCESFLKFFFY